jgi:hypothetical protein
VSGNFLNNFDASKSGLREGTDETFMTAAKKAAGKSFEKDVTDKRGTFCGLVLRVEFNDNTHHSGQLYEPGSMPMKRHRGHTTTPPKLVAIKVRIPVLHSCLPCPSIPPGGPQSCTGVPHDIISKCHHPIIDLYPTFYAQDPGVPIPEVGDTVRVKFANLDNFSDPVYLGPESGGIKLTVVNNTAGAFSSSKSSSSSPTAKEPSPAMAAEIKEFLKQEKRVLIIGDSIVGGTYSVRPHSGIGNAWYDFLNTNLGIKKEQIKVRGVGATTIYNWAAKASLIAGGHGNLMKGAKAMSKYTCPKCPSETTDLRDLARFKPHLLLINFVTNTAAAGEKHTNTQSDRYRAVASKILSLFKNPEEGLDQPAMIWTEGNARTHHGGFKIKLSGAEFGEVKKRLLNSIKGISSSLLVLGAHDNEGMKKAWLRGAKVETASIHPVPAVHLKALTAGKDKILKHIKDHIAWTKP